MARPTDKRTYQQMTKELANLVEWFESDKVNLDEAVIKYEQAVELLRQMENHLKTAQNKVKKIAAKFDSD